MIKEVIDAQFNIIIQQRNDAMNQVVNMTGELAQAQVTIRALTEQITALQTPLADESPAT